MTVETLPAWGIYIELLGRMDVNENVDDLFDYDAGLDDILRQVEQDTNKTTAASSSQDQPNPGKGVLGIDDELQVSRKRAPVAQLDEARLLTVLVQFSDAGRLLNFYRLWLDELYPRAKFTDTLATIEKLGHSKRLQVMRREWIDEGKPRPEVDDDDFQLGKEQDLPTREKGNQQDGARLNPEEEDLFIDSPHPETTFSTQDAVKSLFGGDGNEQSSVLNTTSIDNELFEWESNDKALGDPPKDNIDHSGTNKVPAGFPDDEDDLDRPLAEDDNGINSNSIRKPNAEASASNAVADEYENDWEAMQEHDM
ncbi:replication fork protection component Swi3, putative [Trichophyton verrucosum HKI 0517]|uniref:Chromosome segregation in meiosis protein n=1 Tax=Trichophyton verrucosum (strain HKI 0517) TaxID=663202 RepID=D4D274_TRIVH|nr:replication fork protection component Swi3, putative [Trichophyton verrucosum HKI 0517]EFE44048.1 replication fork protection component Swi3, putative [Trichophyton verrucosum HKI 0517]